MWGPKHKGKYRAISVIGKTSYYKIHLHRRIHTCILIVDYE